MNPYDIDQASAAIFVALTMPAEEYAHLGHTLVTVGTDSHVSMEKNSDEPT